MAIRSLHGLSENFTLTPPLFKPPRYGPEYVCETVDNLTEEGHRFLKS
jgi:hypothetical protein